MNKGITIKVVQSAHSGTPLDRATIDGSNEQGAVLILLAVIASVLFTFIALGIDTGLLSVSRRDHSNMAPKVASAALNAFTSATGSFDQRIAAARTRAEEISQVAIDVATTSYLYKGGSYTAELGSASAPGETGYIEAGIWHFVPTFEAPYFDTSGACVKVNADQCPCDTSGQWAGPCFEKLSASDFTPPSDPNQPFTPPNVTAMRVVLTTRNDSPFQAKFAQTFGGRSDYTLEATATVATRPMRVIYIFDLSRSSHQETHLPFEMVGVMQSGVYNASEYAFKLANKSCAATEPPPPNDGVTNDTAYVTSSLTCKPIAGTCGATVKNPPLGPSDCEFDGGLAFSQVPGAYTALFNYCDPFIYPPGKPASLNRPAYHSKADYRCVTVAPTIDGVSQGTSHYLVDAFRNTSYAGPEPLNTMMRAVRRGITRFKSRNIDGDRLGVIGADQEAEIDQRTFELSEPKPSDAGFTTIEQVFDENENFTLRSKDHMWFARMDAMFNLPDALRAAYTKLTKDPEFHYSDNHIILISDGISECYLDSNDNKQKCEAAQAAIQESLNQSYTFVEDNFPANDIRLSVILLGDMVAPHSLLKKSKTPGNDECMDEDEARNTVDGGGNAEPWVNNSDNSATYRDAFHSSSTSYNATSNSIDYGSDARFFVPNQLHAAVAITGGVWGVVRPPCQATATQLGGASCEDGALESYLDSQCAAAANPGDLLRNISGANGSPITDADGRLLCDMNCRDRDTQIEGYIDEIFDSFPYLSVQSNIQVN